MRAPLLAALALCTIGLSCTRATGKAAAITRVGPSGGSLTSADGLFSIEIPPDALDQSVDLAIVAREDVRLAGLESLAYEISPRGLVFAAPATVRYDASGAPSWRGRRALSLVEDRHHTELSSGPHLPYDRRTHVARGEVSDLVRSTFGLVTLVEVDETICSGAPCGAPCDGCLPRDPGCMGAVDGPVCDRDGRCGAPDPWCPAEGWSGQANTGLTFVVSSLAIAREGQGFDLDGRCRGPRDCIDHTLAGLGLLLSPQLRGAILGGDLLLLIEISGLDYGGAPPTDGSITVKWYEGADFDDPIFPANNFSIPGGEVRCCEFVMKASSLTGSPAGARARIPARVDQGLITSTGTRADGPTTLLPFPIDFGSETSSTAPIPPPRRKLTLRNARLSMRIDTDDTLQDGLLGGVLAIHELALSDAPSCRTFGSLCDRTRPRGTLLDLLLRITNPDVDTDGDGLEIVRVGADGRIDQCLDGDGTPIESPVAEEPWRCAEDPRLADGYSIAYTFSALHATIKGTVPD